jgi:hypothetical protein
MKKTPEYKAMRNLSQADRNKKQTEEQCVVLKRELTIKEMAEKGYISHLRYKMMPFLIRWFYFKMWITGKSMKKTIKFVGLIGVGWIIGHFTK